MNTQHKQELIKIHSGLVRVIASFELKYLRPEILVYFENSVCAITITVWDVEYDNFNSFFFYDSHSIEEIKVKLAVLAKTIKSDNFDRIVELAEL